MPCIPYEGRVFADRDALVEMLDTFAINLEAASFMPANESFSSAIVAQVGLLRVLIDGLQALRADIPTNIP